MKFSDDRAGRERVQELAAVLGSLKLRRHHPTLICDLGYEVGSLHLLGKLESSASS